VAALFIAGKYEEIYSIDVGELVFVTDNAYSKKDVLRMEKKIVQALEFNLGKPLPLHFLRRFSKVAQVSVSSYCTLNLSVWFLISLNHFQVLPMHHNFAKFFLEWSLMDYNLCHVRPSRLAAAALFIAKW